MLVFSLLINVLACNSSSENQNGIYVWNTNVNLCKKDFDFFYSNDISNLYIKFFDVVWSNSPKAEAIVIVLGKIPQNFNVVPCIYIKNEVFKNVNKPEAEELAINVYNKILSLYEKNFPEHQLKEIQLDCDWSKSTGYMYFYFLEHFNKISDDNIKLSVTLRLHQIKYKKTTGVPPVDKGVLMYYNMGEIINYNKTNSILNNKTGKEYINDFSSYPIELSLALPLYSWAVWFKNEYFINILYDINVNSIDTLNFLEKIDNNLYKVIRDTVIDNNYLRTGETIRLEFIDPDSLLVAKQICKPLLEKNHEIILYNYNYKSTNLLENETLKKIFVHF